MATPPRMFEEGSSPPHTPPLEPPPLPGSTDAVDAFPETPANADSFAASRILVDGAMPSGLVLPAAGSDLASSIGPNTKIDAPTTTPGSVLSVSPGDHHGTVPHVTTDTASSFNWGTFSPNLVTPIKPNFSLSGNRKVQDSIRYRLLLHFGLRDKDGMVNESIHPECPFYTWWGVLQALLLMYIALFVPVRVAFESDMGCMYGLAFFDIFIDGYFIMDIILMFFTGYRRFAQIEMNRRKVVLHYFKGRFAFDTIISVPVAWINAWMEGTGCDGGAHGALVGAKMLRLLRLARVARVAKLFNLPQMGRVRVNHFVVQIFKLLLAVGFVMHLAACAWWLVKTFDPKLDDYLEIQNLKDEGVAGRYVSSLYYAAATLTTVGYGDIHGTNTQERAVALLVMMLGAGIFATVISQMSSLIASNTSKEKRHTQKLRELADFVDFHHVPEHLAHRMRDFYHYNHELDRSQAAMDVVRELPVLLRTDICAHLAADILDKVSLFKGAPKEYITAVFMALRPLRLAPEERVFEATSRGAEMYVVYHGNIKLIAPKKSADGTVQAPKERRMSNASHVSHPAVEPFPGEEEDDEEEEFQILGPGSLFGEEAVVSKTPWVTRTFTAQAVGYTELYVLQKPDIETANQSCSVMLERFEQLARERSGELQNVETKKMERRRKRHATMKAASASVFASAILNASTRPTENASSDGTVAAAGVAGLTAANRPKPIGHGMGISDGPSASLGSKFEAKTPQSIGETMPSSAGGPIGGALIAALIAAEPGVEPGPEVGRSSTAATKATNSDSKSASNYRAGRVTPSNRFEDSGAAKLATWLERQDSNVVPVQQTDVLRRSQIAALARNVEQLQKSLDAMNLKQLAESAQFVAAAVGACAPGTTSNSVVKHADEVMSAVHRIDSILSDANTSWPL